MQRFMWLLLVALMWSPTFMLIKVGLREVPPLSLTFLRTSAGLLMLLIFYPSSLRGVKDLLVKHPVLVFSSAALNVALPFALCTIGEYYVESSFAGIIEGCVPVFTVVLSVLALPHARGQTWASPALLGAVLLGLAGIVIISLPSIGHHEWGNSAGIAVLLVMALSFAAGFIFYESKLSSLDFGALLFLQLLFGSLYLLPLARLFEPEFSPWQMSSGTLGSILLLGFAGTSMGLIAFYRLLARHGAQFASLVTYLCLILAIFWGVWLLNEQLTWYTYAGATLIIGSMVCASLDRGSST
jgi:drug/metabolite transporter (DMT)-like permease